MLNIYPNYILLIIQLIHLRLLLLLVLPFGVLDADSIVLVVMDRSLHTSLDGIIGGESGGFVLLACEYKSNT